MSKKTVFIVTLGVLALGAIGVVMSDSEHEYGARHSEEEHEWEGSRAGWMRSREDVAPAVDATYRAECGSCHFAYQPGLLPASAWSEILAALDNHYGDDASLDEDQLAKIRAYLTEHAADRSDRSRARAFARGSQDASSLPRITETAYFRHEHHEIPERLVRVSQAVGSFANCPACHRGADAGVYNEHQVVIPGVGRWDD